MLSANVSIPVDGNAMPGYLARPDGDGPRPAVIVLQEIYGVNSEIRRIVDLLAGAGYVAVAPNFYYRTDPQLDAPYTPEGRDQGIAAAAHVTRSNVTLDIAACIDWLNEQPYVQFGRIATWGFCFGGSVAFLCATLPGLCCAVSFYGAQIANPWRNGEPGALDVAADIRAPLLLAFGGKDQSIPPDAIARIESALKAANKRFDVQIYPDADHAFFRNASSDEMSDDIADAWERVQAFFAANFA